MNYEVDIVKSLRRLKTYTVEASDHYEAAHKATMLAMDDPELKVINNILEWEDEYLVMGMTNLDLETHI